MKSSLEIAQEAQLRPIEEVAARMGLRPEEIEPYGRYKAKISLEVLGRLDSAPDGKLVCVTAMTPTPPGEGKTTTLVGLTEGLGHIGKNPTACLREPSLGPVFGVKGGAAGGGYAQVVPMEDLNLHFTGDIHAVSAANNLLAAMIDSSIHHGNELGLDALRIVWRRAIDMNDRALRNVVVALGGSANGYPRETGFDITAASEVMGILAVARDLQDLRKRLGAITAAYTRENKPITAEDLHAGGPMTVLLREAIKPNLVQTLEGQPCLMHCGPFANIAHGNNSLLADLIARKVSDYVVTESGFGSDMGMTKFFDIVCRMGNLQPSAVVLVVTVRAIKHHGGGDDDAALERGMANVRRHLENVATFGMPCVVGVNRRAGDSDEDLERARGLALEAGAFAADQRRLRQRRRGRRGARAGGRERLRAAELVRAALSARRPDRREDRDRRQAHLPRRRGRVLAARAAQARRVRGAGPRQPAGLHGQDPPLALARLDGAECARGLHAAGPRHTRLQRRRLARAAVRRHPPDAGPRQEAGGVRDRHRQGRAHGRALLSRGRLSAEAPSARPRRPRRHRAPSR